VANKVAERVTYQEEKDGETHKVADVARQVTTTTSGSALGILFVEPRPSRKSACHVHIRSWQWQLTGSGQRPLLHAPQTATLATPRWTRG
jgi:hypothetical protein